jgi:hypothetical protein
MSRYGSRLHVSAGCAWALALWQEVAGSSRPPFARTSPRWERTRVQLSEFSVRFRHLPTLRFSTLPIRLSFRFTFRSGIHSHRRLSRFSGGNRIREKCRMVRIARRPILAISPIKVRCSSNSRNARFAILRHLSGIRKLVLAIFWSSNKTTPVRSAARPGPLYRVLYRGFTEIGLAASACRRLIECDLKQTMPLTGPIDPPGFITRSRVSAGALVP